MNEKNTAYITNIQHFNVHDGAGFRTNIFFQGCLLRCKWCQNPETQSMVPIMMYDKNSCSKCMACVSICPNGAITCDNGNLNYNLKKCNRCLKCEKECYYLARMFSSHIMTLDEVEQEIVKDSNWYSYGGGVTLSGGEPLLQINFCQKLAERIKLKGISVNVETAGFVKWENIKKIIPYVDCFLYDLKLIDKSKRLKWLGTSSDLMLKNLKKLSKIHSNVVIRIPLIPKVNDTDEEFEAIMEFAKQLSNIKVVHILPFHQLGSQKYEMLNKNYSFKNVDEDNDMKIKKCANKAMEYGYLVDIGGTNYY